MRLFKSYQYAAQAILLPTSYYLWLRWLDYDHQLVFFMLSMPILFAYIIPDLGTNWLKLWEFSTGWRLGRFRPHHGFVFGSAISLLALLIVYARPLSLGPFDLIRTGLATGSTMAFWSWLYDRYAVKVGFLVVYTRSYYQNLVAEAIATDYAPVIFGTFCVCYGVAIHISQYYLLELERWDLFGPFIIACNLVLLTALVLAFVLYSLLRNGESGLGPFTGGRD